MDIDTEEGPVDLEKQNDEKILKKEKSIDEEEEQAGAVLCQAQTSLS